MMSVWGQLPSVGRIAERHPGLKLVIDHLGLRSGTKGEPAFAGLPELFKLARHANVAVKASALPCYSVEAYPFRDVQRHIRSVYDAFGPRRMFWGTDWTRLPCTWRQAVTLFTEELPWLSAGDKEWIMGRGVCEWLGWPTPRAT
jgi:predicted TIM-barrel fold metal-dependent hydrolase